MDFDLQDFLGDMRREQREDHQTLVQKVDAGFGAVSARASALEKDLESHKLDDTRRLTILEGGHNLTKWFARVAIGAVVTGAIGIFWDYLVNH